jgi:alpha-beta hydrolase superfamily lysophospholipase
MFPSSFQTSDGLTLSCYGILPPTTSPRARVILIHGLGDHCRGLPYRNLSESLSAHQFAVFAFDWRGHGQSDGPRMFTSAWKNLRNDLQLFVDLVQREAPGGPLFLVGLSLGGLLALNYAQHHPTGIGGVVAVAPAIDSSGVPPLIQWVIPILSRLLPRISVNPGLDLTHISRDRVAVQEYTGDPAFQTHTTPRLAAEVLMAMAETRAQAAQFRLPLLILHGAEDTIVRPAGSVHFLERVSSSDKEHRTYTGAFHNLFIEPNRAEVFGDIVQWLERHL